MASETGERREFVRAGGVLPGAVASAVGYRTEGQAPGLHRGLPSPYLTFIVSLEEPIVTGENPAHAHGPAPLRNDVLLAGLHTSPAYVVQPRQESGIQLAVHPLACRRLFGLPASELVPLTVEGSEVLGSAVEGLRWRLVEAPSWPDRFSLLGGYLRARLDASGGPAEPRPEVVAAWTWLTRLGGAGSMDGLTRHVAMSGRQLHTLFRREVGLGPKAVSRLMRFGRVTGHLATTVSAGRPVSLADVAHEHGYCDHSHLVRDFRQFTGTSPSAWLAEEHRNIQAGGHQNGAESEP